jgi:hypothetical protein
MEVACLLRLGERDNRYFGLLTPVRRLGGGSTTTTTTVLDERIGGAVAVTKGGSDGGVGGTATGPGTGSDSEGKAGAAVAVVPAVEVLFTGVRSLVSRESLRAVAALFEACDRWVSNCLAGWLTDRLKD